MVWPTRKYCCSIRHIEVPQWFDSVDLAPSFQKSALFRISTLFECVFLFLISAPIAIIASNTNQRHYTDIIILQLCQSMGVLPEDRILAGFYCFNTNISLSFQGMKTLSAHPMYPVVNSGLRLSFIHYYVHVSAHFLYTNDCSSGLSSQRGSRGQPDFQCPWSTFGCSSKNKSAPCPTSFLGSLIFLGWGTLGTRLRPVSTKRSPWQK